MLGLTLGLLSSAFWPITTGDRRFRVLRKLMELLDYELQKSMISKRRPPLKRGKVSQRLPVPDHIPQPPYVGSQVLPEISSNHQIHDSEGITRMRAACQLAAQVLENAGSLVRPSVTTNEIDKAVHQMIIDAGAYPSPLGYGGFPKSVCTSVNECMCHGIPDSRQLQDGDIINIDVTVYLNGYHGDTSKTFICGNVNNSVNRLVKVTEECMYKGISACEDGALFRKIGKRISDYAEKFGYGVVDRFVGHGIGTIFHSEPLIFHHRNDKAGRMVEGQTFTIEPILTLRPTECITWEDNWTTVTANGCPAAQFEHTILITRTGAEILTNRASVEFQESMVIGLPAIENVMWIGSSCHRAKRAAMGASFTTKLRYSLAVDW
ncbi:methionine aminopeptidase 1B, chloroplastic [Dorcoceras hygrometricum]|uniref:Methionine aminopeptidase n=1 Tax=Dorcoceras hygrometricum TaxID=472368 RepID=A0A2Z7BEW0_9LAMI|nr:methionine aminopeptidase 1B, chloroplastic [Dorcoceras hygrometricum]